MSATQHNDIAKYRKVLDENVFSCMEMAKQSWPDTMEMPVKKLTDYLKWKSDLEEERRKLMEEKAGK